MAKSVKVKYFDPSGTPRDGYIIDNKTYKDPEGNVRVELGSVVETADGSYTLTKDGGVKTDVLKKNYAKAADQLKLARNEAELAIRNNYESRLRDIEKYKNDAKEYYGNAVLKNNQKKALSEKNLAQKMKAQGISGGPSESTILANNIFYEEQNNELNRELNQTLSDYDHLLLNLESDMEYEIMKSNSEYDSVYAELLTDFASAESSEQMAERALNASNYQFRTNYDREVYEDERDYERGVFESDRQYDFEYATDLRDYMRDVFESDRQYNFEYTTDLRDYQRGVFESDREYNRDVLESDRNYKLSASKATQSSKSSGNDDYQKRLANAKALADFGDFSGYAELFGWTKEQKERAEREYYIK